MSRRKSWLLFSFKEIALKGEDKIFLSIGGIFLVFMLVFILFAQTLFKKFPESQGHPFREDAIQQEITAKGEKEESETPFREFEERFQQLGEEFEEDIKRSHEFFQKAVDNFHRRFNRANKAGRLL